jgi:hypothetical protein
MQAYNMLYAKNLILWKLTNMWKVYTRRISASDFCKICPKNIGKLKITLNVCFLTTSKIIYVDLKYLTFPKSKSEFFLEKVIEDKKS